MTGGAVDQQTMLQQIQEQRMALEHQQQAMTNGGTSNFMPLSQGGPAPQDLSQLSQRGSLKGHGRMSIASEETFGRAMSGLSALSIDWENMDDFDLNVDHSAHINSDIATGGVPPIGIIVGDAASGGVDNGLTEGCAMATGGACTCGPILSKNASVTESSIVENIKGKAPRSKIDLTCILKREDYCEYYLCR